MTEDRPDLDELVSAYLDGEATSDERAAVEADPALVSRVAEWRAIAEAVAADPPPPPSGAREAAVARALEAFAGGEPPAPAGEVVAIEAARARSHRRAGRSLRPLSIAAAVLLAVLAVALVPLLSSGDDDDADTAAFNDDSGSSAQERTPDENDGDAGGGADASGETTTALGDLSEGSASEVPPANPPRFVSFGSIADETALVTAVEDALNNQVSSTTRAETQSWESVTFMTKAQICSQSLAANDPERVKRLVLGQADYDDIEAVVVVFERDNGSREVVATRVSDCRVLASAEL